MMQSVINLLSHHYDQKHLKYSVRRPFNARDTNALHWMPPSARDNQTLCHIIAKAVKQPILLTEASGTQNPVMTWT